MEMILNGKKVNSKTKLTYKANPKKQGTKAFKRYEIYSKFKTIQEYMEKCYKNKDMNKYARADLRWDAEKGYLEFKDTLSLNSILEYCKILLLK